MAIPFLDPANEDRDTKVVTFWAIAAITLGLCGVSVYGIWAQPGNAVGKVFYTLPVVGAEVLCAYAVLRAIQSPTRFRMVLALVTTIGLSWYCVHNVERGIKLAYPELYAEDAQAMKDRAALYATEAEKLGDQAVSAKDDLREDRRLLRQDIAKLEGEQELMTARTAERIMTAQKLLQSKGLYKGAVDGKDEELTAAARREYGETIQTQLESLKRQEAALGVSLSSGAVEASSSRREDTIKQEARARERDREGRLLTIGTWVLEVSRGLGGFLFLGSATVAGLSRLRKLQDDIEAAQLQAKLDALKTPKPAAPEVEPAETEAMPLSEPVAVEAEPDPATIGQRKGGKNADQHRQADKAAKERLLILADRSAESQAMKVAAE